MDDFNSIKDISNKFEGNPTTSKGIKIIKSWTNMLIQLDLLDIFFMEEFWYINKKNIHKIIDALIQTW